eukprot:jgi/Galph1/18/GphlegSOOS_G4774.1
MDSPVITGLRFNAHKAGLSQVNVEEATRVIVEASKGTSFYENETRKEKLLDKKITETLHMLQNMTEMEKQKKQKFVDEQYISKWQEEQNTSRVIVHLDMDAFFASVEELDQPELKTIPMAVGSTSMLSTANYEARKFGVRSAVPGFIGLRLCPQLRIIPPRFDKYCEVSSRISELLNEFDPHHRMTMDEAYLDITHYVVRYNLSLEQAVENIRTKIFQSTGLTCSAGAAYNTLIAKIATDINKPNGQTIVENNVSTIREFLDVLSVRKIPGVGKVTEKLLAALGIFQIQDIIEHRAILYHCLKPKTFEFLLQSALGIGSIYIEDEDSRKGMSRERTFKSTSSLEQLGKICRVVCQNLADDMTEQDLVAKTLTLKIKCSDFTVRTRSITTAVSLYSSEQLEKTAWSLLLKEMPIELRLLGVRVSGLVSRKQFFFKSQKFGLETLLSKKFPHEDKMGMNASRNDESDDDILSLEEAYNERNDALIGSAKVNKSSVSEHVANEMLSCPLCCHFKSSNAILVEKHVNFCAERQERKHSAIKISDQRHKKNNKSQLKSDACR